MTKKDEKEKTYLYLDYDEWDHGGEPLSNERWSNRADRHITVNFKKLFRKEPDKGFADSIEVEDERLLTLNRLFLAVVRYSDGDTFGHSYGHWHVVGLAPNYEIAQLMLEEATKPSEKKNKPYSPNQPYKPWEGYFCSLQDTEVHELSVW